MEMDKQNKVVEIENIRKKVMDKSIAYHESSTRTSDNSAYLRPTTAVIWLWEAFGLCSRFQIIMFKLGKRQTIFLTSYFQFERRFDLIFVCDEYAHILFCVCLPGIMENSVGCHGKSWNFIIRFLWEP